MWLIFLFHKNGGEAAVDKVRPPRLGSQPVGMPCRTIGLSLVTLLGVEDDSHAAGADLVDGTYILDVKPFVPCSTRRRSGWCERHRGWRRVEHAARVRF